METRDGQTGVGVLIRRRRQQRRLSLRALAGRVGLSYLTLFKIEHGTRKLRLDELHALGHELGADLLFWGLSLPNKAFAFGSPLSSSDEGHPGIWDDLVAEVWALAEREDLSPEQKRGIARLTASYLRLLQTELDDGRISL